MDWIEKAELDCQSGCHQMQWLEVLYDVDLSLGRFTVGLIYMTPG